MSGQRQKNRPEPGVLAFPGESRSDAPKAATKGTETLMAKRRSESLAGTERRMEEVCELENWRIANSPALNIALPNAYFAQLGLPPLVCTGLA